MKDAIETTSDGSLVDAQPCAQFTNDQIVEVLTVLLAHNREELTFWRSRNWSALRSTVFAMAALASVSVLRDGQLSRGKTAICIGAVAVIATMHHIYQRKNVRIYANLKRDRTSILKALGVDSKGVYLREKLFENLEARNPQSYVGTPSFVIFGWAFAGTIVLALMAPHLAWLAWLGW